MILIDSSAWIEYLRATDSPTCERVRDLLSENAPIATCDTVVMEVLAGGRSERAARDLMRLLDRCRFFPNRPLYDSAGAASLYRACKRAGFTPRGLNDCAIAAVALENDLCVLHSDRDFDRLSAVSGLLVDT